MVRYYRHLATSRRGAREPDDQGRIHLPHWWPDNGRSCRSLCPSLYFKRPDRRQHSVPSSVSVQTLSTGWPVGVPLALPGPGRRLLARSAWSGGASRLVLRARGSGPSLGGAAAARRAGSARRPRGGAARVSPVGRPRGGPPSPPGPWAVPPGSAAASSLRGAPLGPWPAPASSAGARRRSAGGRVPGRRLLGRRRFFARLRCCPSPGGAPPAGLGLPGPRCPSGPAPAWAGVAPIGRLCVVALASAVSGAPRAPRVAVAPGPRRPALWSPSGGPRRGATCRRCVAGRAPPAGGLPPPCRSSRLRP